MQRLVGEKRQTLIEGLKTTYKAWYNSVQPIPYIRDKLYCVDKVFIEGGSQQWVGRSTDRSRGTSWERLYSYKDIYAGQSDKPKRYIIVAEPGYGKTTLTLQLTFDWSTGVKGCPLSDVDILILLRLRQLGGVPHIYRAIKWYILPKSCNLSSIDIKEVFQHTKSIAILLDGWDEYPEQDTNIGSYIRDMITAELFPDHIVTLTARYLPASFDEATRRVRLTGFDDEARDQYIRKAVVGDDDEAVEQIKRRLRDNLVLADLCQVPLIFVMFAHMAHDEGEFQTFRSVTEFFAFMIKCFHEHLRNKTRDGNVKEQSLKHESDHEELDKLAYEGLSKPDQQIVWSKQELCHRLGQEFYKQYTRIRILVEEEVLDNTEGVSAAATEAYTKEVTFYHKLFCEWYAAHHVSGLALAANETELPRLLKPMDPFDLQYVYRFACGLLPDAAGKIIDHLKRTWGGDKFAVLCILEQTGEVEDIKETIRDLFSRRVRFEEYDPKLLQRSTIQLLDVASRHDIPITEVVINACSPVTDQSGSSLTISSQLSLPVLATLFELLIRDLGKRMSNEEVVGILHYSSQCKALKKLTFQVYDLPKRVLGAEPILSIMESRNVTDEAFFEPATPANASALSTPGHSNTKMKNPAEPTVTERREREEQERREREERDRRERSERPEIRRSSMNVQFHRRLITNYTSYPWTNQNDDKSMSALYCVINRLRSSLRLTESRGLLVIVHAISKAIQEGCLIGYSKPMLQNLDILRNMTDIDNNERDKSRKSLVYFRSVTEDRQKKVHFFVTYRGLSESIDLQ